MRVTIKTFQIFLGLVKLGVPRQKAGRALRYNLFFASKAGQKKYFRCNPSRKGAVSIIEQ